jgi:hypothetical protein
MRPEIEELLQKYEAASFVTADFDKLSDPNWSECAESLAQERMKIFTDLILLARDRGEAAKIFDRVKEIREAEEIEQRLAAREIEAFDCALSAFEAWIAETGADPETVTYQDFALATGRMV